jgi:hypothetical protein
MEDNNTVRGESRGEGCPYCRETILSSAVKCRHCSRSRRWDRREVEAWAKRWRMEEHWR